MGSAESKTTVVVVNDIFSMHEGRCKACCDLLAEHGFRVVFPDLHKGDSIVKNENFREMIGSWLQQHPVQECVAMLSDACNMVRGEGKRVITIGFCWGSWVLYSA